MEKPSTEFHVFEWGPTDPLTQYRELRTRFPTKEEVRLVTERFLKDVEKWNNDPSLRVRRHGLLSEGPEYTLPPISSSEIERGIHRLNTMITSERLAPFRKPFETW